MYSLFKKEISGFFGSLTGYLVMVVFFAGQWFVPLGVPRKLQHHGKRLCPSRRIVFVGSVGVPLFGASRYHAPFC